MTASLEKINMFYPTVLHQKNGLVKKRLTISEQTICQSILTAFSDNETSAILHSSIGVSHTIQDILKKTGISQSSGYRKIHLLIDDGLLIKDGYEIGTAGRKVIQYRSLFDIVCINFSKKLTIDVQFQSIVGK
jgi:hypothetical protein